MVIYSRSSNFLNETIKLKEISSRGLFEDHERVGLSRKFEQSNRRLLTAYLLLYRSVEAYKLLNLPLNC